VIDRKLYSQVLKTIHQNESFQALEIAEFLDELPPELKKNLSQLIYEEIHQNVEFLKGKDQRFIAWMCPHLEPRVVSANECIYYEKDMLENFYFLRRGQANYVLPRFSNQPFLTICEHTCFGLVDFVAALCMKQSNDVMCRGIMSVFKRTLDDSHHHNWD